MDPLCRNLDVIDYAVVRIITEKMEPLRKERVNTIQGGGSYEWEVQGTLWPPFSILHVVNPDFKIVGMLHLDKLIDQTQGYDGPFETRCIFVNGLSPNNPIILRSGQSLMKQAEKGGPTVIFFKSGGLTACDFWKSINS